MKHSYMRGVLFAVALIAVALLTLFWRSSPSDSQNDNVLSLIAPAFVSEAYADSETIQDIAEEAGIAAYYQAPSSITLSEVRSAFRTIEVETPTYIIGSVPVTNYPEDQDVHVYVHVDGWILAYYLAGDPVGKIFDWRVYHDTGRTAISTKLENTLAVVAGAAAVSYTGGTHYHFQYPNATHLMMIVDYTNSGNDTFQINVPGSFAYSERSWSLGGFGNTNGISLNGTSLHGYCSSNCTREGVISASQLLPDQFHTILLNHRSGSYTYGGIALVYREQ